MTTTKLETHPPLARDAAGNPVPFPAGTSSFCLGRETSGRPRLLRGPDKQLLRFPPHTSPEDIIELCGPGVYRVFALDALGEQLGDENIARWDLTSSSAREPRNGVLDPMIALRPERAATLAGPATDLRFALETMAQMMRTNSDALKLVAESQVDLAKTIASVKGLPRNAAMYLPPTPPANVANDDDDDEEEDDDDDDGDYESAQAAPTNFLDLLMPLSEALAPKVAEFVPGLLAGAAAKGVPAMAGAVAAPPSHSAAGADDDIANRPFEARELIDLRYTQRKAAAKRAAAKQQPASNASLQARIMMDPQLRQLVMEIKAQLAPDEITTLITAASKWSNEAQAKFLNTLKPLPVDHAVAYCREVIKKVLAHRANVNAANANAADSLHGDDDEGGDAIDAQ